MPIEGVRAPARRPASRLADATGTARETVRHEAGEAARQTHPSAARLVAELEAPSKRSTARARPRRAVAVG